MKIRPIQSQDDEQLYQLIRKILKSERLDLPGTAYYDSNLGHLEEFYRKSAHAAYFVIADENNHIFGGVGVAPFIGEICELQKLYISTEIRQQGWSKKLMDTALSFAQKYYKQIYLESHTSLETALKLYDKYHFEALERPLEGSEHSLMNVWLLKNLD
ncbi:MAG: GNAT family N-acetyltransferase [Streptococcaceae bacterium]|nr:GNAT family N-acetyltransferase [Streptococcaceae bacterium]